MAKYSCKKFSPKICPLAKVRGAFNKFQDCSSQQAHSTSWKPKVLWSCTATIVHHLPWSHLWHHYY